MYTSPRHRRDEVQLLQKRLQYAHRRLLTHPALTSAPSPTAMPDDSAPVPNDMLKHLFNQVVRRELSVDPSDPTSHVHCRAYLEQARSVATGPSLSSPSLVTSLSSGYQSSSLADKSLVQSVAPSPLNPSIYSPSADAAHQLLKRRREERERQRKLANNAKLDQLQSHQAQQQELQRAQATVEPEAKSSTPTDLPDTSVVDGDAEELNQSTMDGDGPTRRTRSASRRSNANDSGRAPKPSCCFCPLPEFAETLPSKDFKANELLGPFANPKSVTGNSLYVHYECACWAPQVFTDSKTNQLRRVYEEYCRGRQLRCAHCQERGATVGCYVQKCKKVFHFRCLGPGGARRVSRYFVAFCERHAHLAEQESYKTLMNAATIADVAAAYRKDDATHGLDAPHSRYTKLRRREVELIFSTKAKVTSVSAAFHSSGIVFSHRRRTIVQRNERYKVNDGLRAVRMSALDVASGRLAYMAVLGKGDAPAQMSAVDARAAIASPENARIFLLRNLRYAPKWNKKSLHLVKNHVSGAKNRKSQQGRHSRSKSHSDSDGDEEGDKSDADEEPEGSVKSGEKGNLQPKPGMDPSYFSGRYDGDGTPLLLVSPPKKTCKRVVDDCDDDDDDDVEKQSSQDPKAQPGPSSIPENNEGEADTNKYENPDDKAEKTSVFRSRRGRPPKRRRLQNEASEDSKSNESSKDVADLSQPLPRSTRTPALKRLKRKDQETEKPQNEKKCSDKFDGSTADVDDIAKACNEATAAATSAVSPSASIIAAPLEISATTSVCAAKFQKVTPVNLKEMKRSDRGSSSSNLGLNGKVKSAWETFLADELPKERLLRPEDSIEDAMRNMARLWSLMTVSQREAYEECARVSATCSIETDAGKSASCRVDPSLQAYLEQSRRRGRQGISHVSAREAGLFAGGHDSYGKSAAKTVRHETSKRQGSVSLPRKDKDKRGKSDSRRKNPVNESMDLDEMFPEFDVDACLESDEDDEYADNVDDDDDYSGRPVRPPPPPRRRRK